MKLVKRLVLVFLAAVLLLFGVGYLLVTPASRRAVEKAGRYALGVETTLDDVVLLPRFGSSSLGFTGLVVHNPEGIAGEPFLSIGEFRVAVRTFSLLSGTVEVPEIELDQLHLRLIQDGKRSNFKEILGHARRLIGGKGPRTPGQGGAAGPTLALGQVRVKGVAATLELRGIPGVDTLSETFSLPGFELDLDRVLGGASGAGGAQQASVGDLTAVLVDELVSLAVAELERQVDPEIMALLEGDLEEALEARVEAEVEGLLEEAKGKLDEELGGRLKELLGDG